MTVDTESAVESLYNRSIDVVTRLRARGDVASDNGGAAERRSPRIPITRAADLVGRTGAAVREAERLIGMLRSARTAMLSDNIARKLGPTSRSPCSASCFR